MEHRLLKILSRFDIATWKRCRLFVQMELSGNRPIEIYDYLMKTKSQTQKWDIDTLYSHTLKELSKKSFQNELSRLTYAVENFISYQEFKEENQYQDLLLRQYYLRHGDHKSWEANFYKAINRYNKQEHISFMDQYDLIRVLHQAYFNTHPIKKAYVIDILEQLKYTSESTLTAYRSYIDLILHHENSISQNPQSVLSIADKSPFNIEFFESISQLQSSYSEELMTEVMSAIDGLDGNADPEIVIVSLGLITEMLFKETGTHGLSDTTSQIASIMLKELNWMEQANITITSNKIYRLVTFLAYVDNTKQMIEILDRYKVSMSHEPYYQLSEALLMMSEGDFSKAISHLNKIESLSIQLKRTIRNQLIRAYSMHYEQVDFCLDEIQKFKKWVRNHRNLMSTKTELGLIRSMDVLSDILKNKPVEGILKKFGENQPLSGRMWLLKEVIKRYRIDTSLSKNRS